MDPSTPPPPSPPTVHQICYADLIPSETVHLVWTPPVSRENWISVGLMPGQRRRRWPSIKPTLIHRLWISQWMILDPDTGGMTTGQPGITSPQRPVTAGHFISIYGGCLMGCEWASIHNVMGQYKYTCWVLASFVRDLNLKYDVK